MGPPQASQRCHLAPPNGWKSSTSANAPVSSAPGTPAESCASQPFLFGSGDPLLVFFFAGGGCFLGFLNQRPSTPHPQRACGKAGAPSVLPVGCSEPKVGSVGSLAEKSAKMLLATVV